MKKKMNVKNVRIELASIGNGIAKSKLYINDVYCCLVLESSRDTLLAGSYTMELIDSKPANGAFRILLNGCVIFRGIKVGNYVREGNLNMICCMSEAKGVGFSSQAAFIYLFKELGGCDEIKLLKVM